MKTKWVAAAVIVLGVLTLSVATPVSPRSSGIYVVTGTFASFDEAESVLILRPDGSSGTVKYSIEVLGTRITRNDKDIMLEALRPGQRVTVDFRAKRGYNIAVAVALVTDPKASETK